jgi:hypothetical protein
MGDEALFRKDRRLLETKAAEVRHFFRGSLKSV